MSELVAGCKLLMDGSPSPTSRSGDSTRDFVFVDDRSPLSDDHVRNIRSVSYLRFSAVRHANLLLALTSSLICSFDV